MNILAFKEKFSPEKRKVMEETKYFLDKAVDDTAFMSEIDEVLAMNEQDITAEEVVEILYEPTYLEWIAQTAIDNAVYDLVSIGQAIKDFLMEHSPQDLLVGEAS